jgi:acyl-CoA synthetase (AMP-forming)/AMP-acid ligase II
MDRFDAATALALIEKHRVTTSQWVPTMFVRILKLPADVRAHHDISSLEYAVHAAAPCPRTVKRQMIDWWGPILHEYYGGTEGNGITYCNSEEWLAHEGTVGRPILGELHIVDDDGDEQPANVDGIVYFGGGPPFEYHNDPDATSASRDPKGRGWTTLGDIGHVDDDGYLYLTDRRSHMIITGGVNVYPQEVENLLIAHPAVLDVAVIGVPHDEFGEAVKAVVQPADGVSTGPRLADDLIAYCRDHLADVKCPKSVDFREQLPRHPTGKLYKRLLRDEYWADHSSRLVAD